MKEPNGSTTDEINRLKDDVAKHAKGSREHLDQAVTQAWRAGRLLLAERKRVRRLMGRDAWALWLKQNFRAPAAMAQRYIHLAELAPDEATLRGLSIRQSYFRLGIATEPKSRALSFRVPLLPAHLRYAGRLLVALQVHRESGLTATKRSLLQEDLRPVYLKLRKLFEPTNSPTRAGGAVSH
jgi:hypothetical protein